MQISRKNLAFPTSSFDAHRGQLADHAAVEAQIPASAVTASFVTRRVPPTEMWSISRCPAPIAGDLVIARVEQVGAHEVIELHTGRKQVLYPGRLLLLSYADRYAPDQFEAVVPTDLDRCHLVSSGGMAGTIIGAHDSMRSPTTVMPLGLVVDDDGRALNLARFGLDKTKPIDTSRPTDRPPVIAVLGSSMNAGKTECAVRLIRRGMGLGLRVAAAKVTGTGAGNDLWRMGDAGAEPVFDFTDVGFASTSRLRRRQLETIALELIARLADTEPDLIVIEVSDGVLQPETAALINSPKFRALIDGVVFAGSDALGTVAGIQSLVERRFDVIGASGTMSRSPLARREVERATSVPTYTADEIADCSVPMRLPSRRRRIGR